MTAPECEGFAKTLGTPANNPEPLKIQYCAFSWQIPWTHLIILSSIWIVPATHMAVAPLWLIAGIPILLTLVCAARISRPWRSGPRPKVVRYALRCVCHLTLGSACAVAAWSFLLFLYGNAYDWSYSASYIAILAITCIFSLVHLRWVALTVTIFINGALVFFFAAIDKSALYVTATNLAILSIGVLAIAGINRHAFKRMAIVQSEARRKHEDQSRLLRMLDDMPVAVMTVEPGTLAITYANETSKELIRKLEHLLPIKADDLLGTSIDVFHRNPQHQRRILADPRNLPHNARISLGPEVLDLKVSAVIADDGSYIGPMLTWALVTNEVEAQNRILQLAHYDVLTGLRNRVTFLDEMAKSLAEPGNRSGVLYIDLDGFKIINDTRGHRTGDIVLAMVADRLRVACHGCAITVGRIGGDEFAVLISHTNSQSATQLANRIIEALSTPYNLNHDQKVQLAASVGVALAPEHGEAADILLARADLALYAAKAAGRKQVQLFSMDMETRVQDRELLKDNLRDALETKDGLFVFYQPIVNAETGKTTSREALVRWYHPNRGWVSPAEFVPVAEQSGLIEQLGRFVLEKACHDALERNDGAKVAVNVSAVQLGKGILVPTVLSALVSSGLPPDRLEIEVTETALLSAGAASINDLHCIRGMGVSVALDDFGTGYSSLSHLRLFPFDKIKIDGSFVKEAVDRPESAAVVKAIADLGERLGVVTVAEGVETQEQLDSVRKQGCTEIQGYLCGRPTPNAWDISIIDHLCRQPPEA